MNDNRFLQLITALTVIAVGMVAVAMIGGDSVHMGITLVTGILLIAVMWDRHVEEISLAPAPVAEIPSDNHDLIADHAFREIVEHLSDPVLVVDRGKVTLANPGALKLLGQHIVGQDVRIAIRHPAAAQRLASADSVDKAVCIDIVGLGARNLRWAMQIIPITQPGVPTPSRPLSTSEVNTTIVIGFNAVAPKKRAIRRAERPSESSTADREDTASPPLPTGCASTPKASPDRVPVSPAGGPAVARLIESLGTSSKGCTESLRANPSACWCSST